MMCPFCGNHASSSELVPFESIAGGPTVWLDMCSDCCFYRDHEMKLFGYEYWKEDYDRVLVSRGLVD